MFRPILRHSYPGDKPELGENLSEHPYACASGFFVITGCRGQGRETEL